MKQTIEFFFDFVSPTTYLAWTQLPGLAQRTGATMKSRPFFLGGVFKATGNTSPITVPAKHKYLFRDIERYASHYGVPYRFNPHFPMNTMPLLRAAVSYQLEGRFDDFVSLMFKAIWERGANIGDEAEFRSILQEGGFDAADFAERIQRPEAKQGLMANTDEAVKRGAFGAPTFFVGDEMFFGQDRLDMVELAVRAAAGRPQ